MSKIVILMGVICKSGAFMVFFLVIVICNFLMIYGGDRNMTTKTVLWLQEAWLQVN